jgi:hypothetical protein
VQPRILRRAGAQEEDDPGGRIDRCAVGADGLRVRPRRIDGCGCYSAHPLPLGEARISVGGTNAKGETCSGEATVTLATATQTADVAMTCE